MENLPSFWANGVWPKDSPDLKTIENLSAIVQQEVNRNAPATTTAQLAARVQTAWSLIQPDVLENLVAGIPQ